MLPFPPTLSAWNTTTEQFILLTDDDSPRNLPSNGAVFATARYRKITALKSAVRDACIQNASIVEFLIFQRCLQWVLSSGTEKFDESPVGDFSISGANLRTRQVTVMRCKSTLFQSEGVWINGSIGCKRESLCCINRRYLGQFPGARNLQRSH